MGKVKVTFFLQNLETGGAERSTVRLANALNMNIFDVSFLLCKRKGPLLQNLSKDIKIVDLKKNHVSLSLFKVIRYFKSEKPDIVVSVLDHVNIISILAGLFCKRKPKIIITERSTFSRVSTYSATKFRNKLISRFLLPYLAKVFYKKADLIVCVSKGVADDIVQIIGNLSTIKVIYNPVIGNNFSEFAEEKIENFNVKIKSLPIIIAVGRLTKAKDYPTLLKAFSLVLKETPANLLIVGEGEERQRIEKLIEELDIMENVVLLGFQKNPIKYMVKSDVFVLSSMLEGFPNVLVEAMACGIPVISTDCQSGPNEIIENGKNGLLVLVSDEKKIAESIIELLKNPELRSKFSEEGKKRAQYFSIDKSVKEFENIFKNMLEK